MSRRVAPIVVFLTLALSCTAANDVLMPGSSGGLSHIVPTMVPAPSQLGVDACIGSPSGLCRDHALYLAGDRPHIVAFVSTPAVGQRAVLWRRDGEGPWVRIASPVVSGRGTAAWQWETSSADVRNGSFWRFKYVIAGVGISDVVRLRIIEADF